MSLLFPDISAVIEIITGLNKPRTGWLRRDVPAELAETVLQHSIKVGIAAYHYHHSDTRAFSMGLIHDLGEYRTPDYTPADRKDPKEKHREERNAVLAITRRLGVLGPYVRHLWEEAEARETTLAINVKQLDKFDPVVQALLYDRLGFTKVRDFFPHGEEVVKGNLRLERIYERLMSERPEQPYQRYFELLQRG